MQELTQYDLTWCLRHVPHDVFKLVLEHPNKVVIAGGFLRAVIANEKANDIDIFCPSADLARAYAELLALHRGVKVFKTDNAYSVKGGANRLMVQFIHRWTYDTPEALLESFDFTVAKAAIWFDAQWVSLVDERFYPDLAAKRLVYTSPKRNEDAGGSMLRVLKFYQRGYRIPLDSLGAVIGRLVSAVDFDAIHRGEEQVSKVITGLLREVDPSIDLAHLSHLPSMQERDAEVGVENE